MNINKNSLKGRFVRFVLTLICRRLVHQGFHHKDNIIEYYAILHQAAKDEFYEDNDFSLNAFLQECHNDAMLKNN